jgi:methylmalonyl-CoA carboxyltransferase large subunit
MSPDAQDQQLLQQAIESLRAEIARLSDRVAALEGANLQPKESFSTGTHRNYAPGALEPDDALICVISAAVAAYLGVHPHIRQIRLVGGTSWAQQGRVTIQASHALPIRHG